MSKKILSKNIVTLEILKQGTLKSTDEKNKRIQIIIHVQTIIFNKAQL